MTINIHILKRKFEYIILVFTIVFLFTSCSNVNPQIDNDKKQIKNQLKENIRHNKILVKNSKVQTEMRNNVISFSTNKGEKNPVYYSGEIINFYIKLSKPLYVYVFNINRKGDVHLLFYNKEKFIENYTYEIPSSNDKLEIIVKAPYGREIIKVFASEKYIEFPDINYQKTRALKKQKNGNMKKFNVVQELRKIAKSIGSNYYEKSIFLETKN